MDFTETYCLMIFAQILLKFHDIGSLWWSLKLKSNIINLHYNHVLLIYLNTFKLKVFCNTFVKLKTLLLRQTLNIHLKIWTNLTSLDIIFFIKFMFMKLIRFNILILNINFIIVGNNDFFGVKICQKMTQLFEKWIFYHKFCLK